MAQRDAMFAITTWMLDRIFTGRIGSITVPIVTVLFVIWLLRLLVALRSGDRLMDDER